MKEYNKLVRDKIPDIIKEAGEKPITHIAEEKEYEKALARKLQEEVAEFLANPSIEEVIDIFEVIYSICVIKGIPTNKLEEIRQKKADKRGSFKNRIILERTE